MHKRIETKLVLAKDNCDLHHIVGPVAKNALSLSRTRRTKFSLVIFSMKYKKK